jgi:3-phosphoshikimate 1-carboxyvinyltransferase
VVENLFEPLGIATEYTAEGARLRNCQPSNINCQIDFTHCPDIAQTLAVTYCILGIPFTFEGIHSLRIKETDRVAALIAELRKLGYVLHAEGSTRLTWDGKRTNPIPCPTISTYEDHRMAMAFAPAAIYHKGLSIEHPEVVKKSYPNFWIDFNRFAEL